jgi:hypothetical protein
MRSNDVPTMAKSTLRLGRVVAVLLVLASACSVATPAVARAVMDGSRPCPAATEACSVAAVTRYLDSITDPSIIPSIPLTATARRFENGLDTGDTPEAIRATLAADALLVRATEERRVVAVPTGPSTFDVIVRYLVQTNDEHPATAHVMERFTVISGLIDEIDAVMCIAAGAHESSRNRPPAEIPDNQGMAGIIGGAVCMRSLPAAATTGSGSAWRCLAGPSWRPRSRRPHRRSGRHGRSPSSRRVASPSRGRSIAS